MSPKALREDQPLASGVNGYGGTAPCPADAVAEDPGVAMSRSLTHRALLARVAHGMAA